MGFFEKIKNGLKKTKEAISSTLGGVFSGFSGVNDEFYDELEESMILADLGVETSVKAVELLRQRVREQKLKEAQEVQDAFLVPIEGGWQLIFARDATRQRRIKHPESFEAE